MRPIRARKLPGPQASTLSAVAGSSSTQLTWTGFRRRRYNVLRSDMSCSAGSTIIATIPGLTYTDLGLANGFPQHYRVQAVATNPACDGPVSSCRSVIPQPFAGTVRLDSSRYACASVVGVSVSDANIGTSTVMVSVASSTEPAGQRSN
jgi:hypothetical protein